ncbi:patatin-like phospholipase family protein [Dongia soli]|uniref:Patatin-like phospholipase family protein n=1 Tax=Dongia soli TaxID=600628 RepID=A0ABU5EET0_9PROT|nr:patatin-like phospholipase family protein [Dongia soli]MDY0884837.1 patatin-like phospholipase family protein [Dongia soli]
MIKTTCRSASRRMAIAKHHSHLRLKTCTPLIVALLFLAGCAELLRDPAPPTGMPIQPDGFDHVRYYPIGGELDKPSSEIPLALDRAYLNETPDNYEFSPDGVPIYNYLAVSGGGSDGAFGAGLLNGWSKHGGRPQFKIVTGVSTGSLIAPFAFLGPDYDEQLKKAYTTISAEHIAIAHDLFALIWAESLSDNKPFQELVSGFVDDKMLDRIAAEHAKGRRLLVLTTDLDREQPVIWDMGAIASSKSKDRLKLFRNVLIASASIPTIFPPVMLKVTIDGKQRDEMHVDGGVFAQSFFVGNQINIKEIVHEAHPDWQKPAVQRLYVIRNGWITPKPEIVKRSLADISMHSINTLLKVSGINDLYRLYVGDLGGELELRYIAIPKTYVPLTMEQFNQQEMIREFNFGEKMAMGGIQWRRLPPGYRP